MVLEAGTSFGDYPEITTLLGWAKWLGGSLLVGALLWGVASMVIDVNNSGRHLRVILGVAACGVALGGIAALVSALV